VVMHKTNQLPSGIKTGLVVGFFSGLFIFLPACWLTSKVWDYIFFDVLQRHSNTNIDDYLLIYFYGPLALLISTLFGSLGGYLGFKRWKSDKAAIIGSIIGGILGVILIACWMTYTITHWWAT